MSDRISVGDAEDRKLKRKLETENEKETEDLLTLRLCSNYYMSGEVTHSSSGTIESDSSAPESVGVVVDPSSQRPVFACRICGKEFYSSQSLAGHQNAHRQRDQIKLSKEMESGTSSLGQPASPFYPNLLPVPNLPIRGGSPSSQYGVHMNQHPVAAGDVSSPRHGYGHGSELLNSPPSANLYGLGSPYYGAAATTVGVAGGFGCPSSLAIPNANPGNPAAAAATINIGGLQENSNMRNNQQQGSATATGEGDGLDLDLTFSVGARGSGEGEGQDLDLSLSL